MILGVKEADSFVKEKLVELWEQIKYSFVKAVLSGGSKQEVTKLFPFVKLAEKHGSIPIHPKNTKLSFLKYLFSVHCIYETF